jgi:hypothetical protein
MINIPAAMSFITDLSGPGLAGKMIVAGSGHTMTLRIPRQPDQTVYRATEATERGQDGRTDDSRFCRG